MDAMRKDDGLLSLFLCGSRRSTLMCERLAEGSLARKAPNYIVFDAASRSCNSLNLPAEQLAGVFDILFNAIWERRV